MDTLYYAKQTSENNHKNIEIRHRLRELDRKGRKYNASIKTKSAQGGIKNGEGIKNNNIKL